MRCIQAHKSMSSQTHNKNLKKMLLLIVMFAVSIVDPLIIPKNIENIIDSLTLTVSWEINNNALIKTILILLAIE